jgi:hypothetical protein
VTDRFHFVRASSVQAIAHRAQASRLPIDDSERIGCSCVSVRERVRVYDLQDIQRRFGALLARAERGDLREWAGTAEGRVALILVCDQFARHVRRYGVATRGTALRHATRCSNKLYRNGQHQQSACVGPLSFAHVVRRCGMLHHSTDCCNALQYNAAHCDRLPRCAWRWRAGMRLTGLPR